MNNGLRLTFRRGDFAAILLVAAVAVMTLAAFFPGSEAEKSTVQIFQDGWMIRECPLDENAMFQVIGEYKNIVTVENGRVSITDSDCPGRDCVYSGWIDSAGRSVVCLPNRVEIRVTGENEVDFTVR